MLFRSLPDFTRDDEYLRLLDEALARAFDQFAQNASQLAPSSPVAGATGLGGHGSRVADRGSRPGLIWYLAGADPYMEDQLGGLGLTMNGLKERDRKVIQAAKDRGIPLAVTFAGGYARRVEDTVQIHVNTVLAAREIFGKHA